MIPPTPAGDTQDPFTPHLSGAIVRAGGLGEGIR
jgi:hypothetical protein